METARPPQPTGKPPVPVSLMGCFCAFRGSNPVMVHFQGAPGIFYLPCFEDAEKMKTFLDRVKIPFDSVKKIMDSMEFLSSFADYPEVKVVLDPYFTKRGTIRFLEVKTSI